MMTLPTPHSRRRLRLAALTGSLVTAFVSALLVTPPASALSGSNTRLHDPSAIVVDGCTYAFSTGFENDPANPSGSIMEYKTCDANAVTGWTKVQNVWSSTPAWITQKLGRTPPNIWAPDVNFFDGKYHLYYGASLWGTADAVMGLLTADSIEGPWTDEGMVTDVHYPIDPDVVRGKDGRLYVSWGSWTGGASYMHVLDESTGKLSTTDDSLWTIARGVEGVSIVQHGGYFYLFGSQGSCCSGVNSTYYTAVARATSVTGPYLDKNGKDMTSGSAGTRLLSGFGSKVAAGGGDVFARGDQDFFAYHYYDAAASGRETLDIRPLSWADGWPVFGDPIGDLVASGKTTITGRPVPGQQLTGNAPTFTTPVDGVAYQWMRNGVAIDGATQASFTPSTSDVEADISLRVTATRDGYTPGSSSSDAVRILAQPDVAQGVQLAKAKNLSSFTQGSAEIFRRAVAAVEADAAMGEVADQVLRDRLTDAELALVSADTLLRSVAVGRSWVTASAPAWGNGASAADNGWRMFDGDLTSSVDTSGANGSVTVTVPDASAFALTRVELYPRGGLAQRLVGHKLQGSNDGGATWTTFATVSSATADRWTVIDLPTPVSYSAIRLLDDHGGYTNVAEARLMTRDVDVSLLDLLLGDAEDQTEEAYTPESWSVLEGAVGAARSADRSTQANVDEASTRLRAALDALALRAEPEPSASPTPEPSTSPSPDTSASATPTPAAMMTPAGGLAATGADLPLAGLAAAGALLLAGLSVVIVRSRRRLPVSRNDPRD